MSNVGSGIQISNIPWVSQEKIRKNDVISRLWYESRWGNHARTT